MSTGLSEDHHGTFRDVNGDPHIPHPPLYVAEMRLQVFDEQNQLAGRGQSNHVMRVAGQLDVVGWPKHVVDTQTEQDKENYYYIVFIKNKSMMLPNFIST